MCKTPILFSNYWGAVFVCFQTPKLNKPWRQRRQAFFGLYHIGTRLCHPGPQPGPHAVQNYTKLVPNWYHIGTRLDHPGPQPGPLQYRIVPDWYHSGTKLVPPRATAWPPCSTELYQLDTKFVPAGTIQGNSLAPMHYRIVPNWYCHSTELSTATVLKTVLPQY